MPTYGALNAIIAPDAYSPAATIDTHTIVGHINIDVQNQAIYWSVKQTSQPGDPPTVASWQPEVFMAVGSRTIDRDGLVGVRIRAAIPAAALPGGTPQAIATVEVVG